MMRRLVVNIKEWLSFNYIMCLGYITQYFESDNDINS